MAASQRTAHSYGGLPSCTSPRSQAASARRCDLGRRRDLDRRWIWVAGVIWVTGVIWGASVIWGADTMCVACLIWGAGEDRRPLLQGQCCFLPFGAEGVEADAEYRN
jgi:hypothetical protein